MRHSPPSAGPWLPVAAASLAVAALCCGGKEQGPKYETSRVARGSVVARVTASGTLSPTVTVQVGTQVSGRIRELLADFNSIVKKGDVIARIDPQLFQAALDQARANDLAARANLARAQAQAEDAERQAVRARELVKGKFVAQADLDTAEATARALKAGVGAARAAVEQARAALKQAEVNLAYTTIVSPIDGVVISRNVDVGQTVAASFQAPTLFTIAEDLRKMQVHCSVAEADVGRLAAGMEASFVVDAWPGERFRGTIREVRNAPQTVQNVVTYDAVIDIANPELKLKPGMTANVTVEHTRKDGVLKVPNPALRFRPPADRGGPSGNDAKGTPAGNPTPDRRTVWVLRDGKPEAVPVRIGVTDGTATEIVEGALQEGDEVVTEMTGGRNGTGAPGGGGAPFRRMF